MQLSSQSGSNQEFSVRHCNYATARDSFVDGINEYGYNRKAEDGGKPIFAYRYLTNGLGDNDFSIIGDYSVLKNNLVITESHKNNQGE